jgi:hypothetical protein
MDVKEKEAIFATAKTLNGEDVTRGGGLSHKLE